MRVCSKPPGGPGLLYLPTYIHSRREVTRCELFDNVKAFPPAEAKCLADRLELHYTPKHGNWLNLAEIELSVPARQCLDRRLPDRDTLAREVAAWEAERNTAGGAVDWRFTTADARIKLQHLYPAL